MKIADIRCYNLFGTSTAPASEERQVGMLDIYPDYAARPVPSRATDANGGSPIEGAYVEVESDDGVVGIFGPIFTETAHLILAKLRPTLLGKDPLAYELAWGKWSSSGSHTAGWSRWPTPRATRRTCRT